MANENKPKYQACVCCGEWRAKEGYDYCYRCKRKWEYIVASCVKSGIPLDKAKQKATQYYPRRYRVMDKETLAVLEAGKVVDIKVEDIPKGNGYYP